MTANHVYRVVWSEALQAWVAVSEIVRAHGKRSSRSLLLALPAAIAAAAALADGTPTTVVPTGGQTTAYMAANGKVPVVNINAANAAGLSHNRYTRYDVDSNGLVLNNGNAAQIQRKSDLAGSVQANLNLNKEASVILNEVVSANRSILAGFTEVVGGKADVVVANPYGITCSGCGFINTNRATLTTGTPQFNAGGGLAGFAVDRGDILVQGTGLNASGQQVLDLVARSIKVEGPINTSASGSLQLVAGANHWSYESRNVTGAVAGSGPVPTYAIDSTALGGMYAGRIRLIATEAGVGVRMLGEAAASADDFRLDAAGQVVIDAHLSAKRNMAVSATAPGADITLASAGTKLAAGENLTVSTAAGGGGNIENQGLLLAGGKLTVEADDSIVNDSGAAMSGLGELAVTAATGDITNAGWFYSGGPLTVHVDNGTFANRSTGTLWSDGDMTLSADRFVNNNWVQAAGDIAITTTTSFSNEFEDAQTLVKLDDDSTASYSGEQQLSHTAESDYWVYGDNITVWYKNKQAKQKFDRDVPSDDDKLIAIVSGHDMAIDSGAGELHNIGAVLSAANDITINGTGNLDNATLFLDTRKYTKRYALHNWYDVCLFGLCVTTHYDFYSVKTAAQYDAGFPKFVGDSIVWPTVPWHVAGLGLSGDYGPLKAKAESDAQWILLGLVANATEERRKALINAGGTLTIQGLSVTGNGSVVESSPTRHDRPEAAKSDVPTNLNGKFVPAKDSSAKYLIESNSLYGLGSDYAGSDYLLKSLGIDPEGSGKRLGDANYEAYLIRQQLIGQTGSAVLNGYASEAAQMTRLMDQAAAESKGLGLTIGQALTPDQIAGLKQDIVWMVETTVAGQKVLKPVVYLASESRKSIVSGAVIAGSEINMNVASLTNTGGTIKASGSLTVVSEGDIRNVSGTIKGGDVTLESTGGSIVHRTYSEGRGDAGSEYMTTIGKKAGIEATGNLDVHAAKDISVAGADIAAGGKGSLTADSGNITVDTIVDKATTTTRTGSSTGFLTKSGPTTTTTATERNIGSSIVTGGDFTLKSGGDTTLAGTRATVGGNLNVDTGGDFGIVSRQDKTTIHEESSTTGLGVGGGLWGTEKKTVDDFTGTNFGSSISVGGDADMTRIGKDLTLRGSDLAIGGTGTIEADSVKIEQGLDERHTVTRTESTTFLSTGSNKEGNKTGQAAAESGHGAASAGASVAADASESSELNIMEKRTTTVDHTKTSGVASHLSTGNDLTVTARNNVTVQGSGVEAGKALSVDAKNIDILAGENREQTTTTSSSSKIGIYTDSEANAGAEAGASATRTSASARAEAGVEAKAGSTVTVGARFENSTDETTTITHTSSSLKSGTGMTLTADERAKFVGARVDSGGDLAITAKDITNLAAQDSTTTTREKTIQTTGVYLEGEVSGELKGSLKAGPGNFSASGGGGVSGEGGAGLHYSHEKQNSSEGAITNVVSTFKAGGSITRTATDTITDQGTQLEAKTDITQSAATLKEIAAEDKTWSSASSEKHDGKIGVYVGGSYQGDAGAQSSVLSTGVYKEDLGPEASAGIKAKYTYDMTSESSTQTTAVTSRYKAGGSISSTTTDKTTLIGTQFEAGKDVSITASSLDYQAAKDTSSSSSETRSGSAEAKLKVYGTTGVDLNGGYEQSKSSSTSSTARAGGITAGGNVKVTATQGDVRLEGTGIEAGETASVKSDKGSVTFDAARSTTHEETSGFNVSAGFGLTKDAPKGGGKDAKPDKESKTTLGGGYEGGKGDSTTERGVSIKARNVEVSAEKDVTLRGTQVDAGDSASVTAKTGDVRLLETVNTESGSSFGISAKATAMRRTDSDGTKSSADYGGANVSRSSEERQTGSATSIKSGGDLTVKGRNVVSQEAQFDAGGTRKVEGTVQNQGLTRIDKGRTVDLSLDASRKTTPAAKSEASSPSDGKSAKAADKKTRPVTKRKPSVKREASSAASPRPASSGPAAPPGR